MLATCGWGREAAREGGKACGPRIGPCRRRIRRPRTEPCTRLYKRPEGLQALGHGIAVEGGRAAIEGRMEGRQGGREGGKQEKDEEVWEA